MERVVLHVMEALEGGTARHLVDVVRHTPRWQHHVAIPTRRVGAPTDLLATGRLRDAGAVIHPVEMRRSPPQPANAKALWQLIRLIRRVDAAVVHAHSSVGGALGRVAAAATRRPAVYTAHALARGRSALAIERGLGRVTTRFIALSPSEAALVRDLRIVRPDRLVIIPNGIEPDPPTMSAAAADLRSTLGLAPATPLVGTVGRLIHQKAPERFVHMAARVAATDPAPHFLLVGDGPLGDAVTDELGRTTLNGRFHHLRVLPDVAGSLDQLDVFVLASRFEGGPYAPLEAMRAGTPVVLTDVVGNRDAIDPESGVLVAEDDEAALAAAVAELLADPERRAALGAAGQARVREKFDVRAMGAQLATLYDGVSDSSKRHRKGR